MRQTLLSLLDLKSRDVILIEKIEIAMKEHCISHKINTGNQGVREVTDFHLVPDAPSTLEGLKLEHTATYKDSDSIIQSDAVKSSS
jgi:hypothetical protein